jgi:hypothetical protein
LQVDKTPERSFEDKKQNDYDYPTAVVELASWANGHVQKLQGFQSKSRTSFQKYSMKPGTYIVKVTMKFDPQW